MILATRSDNIVTCTIVDDEGTAVDPDAIELWWKLSPTGREYLVPSGSMTHEGTGIYSYAINPPDDGQFDGKSANVYYEFRITNPDTVTRGKFAVSTSVFGGSGSSQDFFNGPYIDLSGFMSLDNKANDNEEQSGTEENKWVDPEGVNQFSIGRRTLYCSTHDVFPSDVTSQSAALKAMFDKLTDLGGGAIVLDRDEPYLISSKILIPDFAGKIIIENKAKGILKAANTLSDSMLSFGKDTDGAVGNLYLETYDLRLDNSVGVYQSGAASCTGLSVRWLRENIHHNFECIGGYNAITGAEFGDSGFACVGTPVSIFYSPKIHRQPDAAFYTNWDNSGDIDGYVEINNPLCDYNKFCSTAKRNLKEMVVRGGRCYGNEGGWSSQHITGQGPGGADLDGVRYQHLDGVTMLKTRANVFVFRGATKGKVTRCHVKDVGYRPDGSSPAGTNGRVVYLLGASGIEISGNTFEMADWTPNGEYVYSHANDTLNGVTRTQGGNKRFGNTYRNWSRIGSGGNDGNPNLEEVATMDAMAEDSANWFSSGTHPDSCVDFRLITQPRIRRQFSNARYQREGEYTFTVADDAIFDLGDLFNGGIGLLQLNTISSTSPTVATVFRVRTSGTEICSIAWGLTTNIAASTAGPPNGTTGADGNVTVFAETGNVWVENRSGGSITLQARWWAPGIGI